MKLLILPLLVLLAASFSTSPLIATKASYKDTVPEPRMKQYWLVFLLKGNNRTQDSATATQLQQGHMANIERLAREGAIVMAGPMGYDKDLRGIFVMNAKDSATAAGYIKTDPAVIAGRLRFEIHPWWVQQGTYIFK
jgi:uncharacterized protein